MLRVTSLISAAALLFATSPLIAADKDEKKDDTKKTEQKSDTKPSSSGDYTSVGEYSGVLARGPGKSGHSIGLRGAKLSVQTSRGRSTLRATEDVQTVEMTPDVRVRFMNPPPRTDEKGKKIPYTEKELRELKGDPNMKGYKADVDDLKAGQIVTIHVVRLKGAKGEMAEKLFVDRIYITGDSGLPAVPEKPGERKKDK